MVAVDVRAAAVPRAVALRVRGAAGAAGGARRRRRGAGAAGAAEAPPGGGGGGGGFGGGAPDRPNQSLLGALATLKDDSHVVLGNAERDATSSSTTS